MSDTLNSQVLILPINNCAFSAGYKNQAYLNQQGYNHYGVDLYSNVGNQTVYACGDGEVVACGWDGVRNNERLGNVIAIIYKNVKLLHNASTATGKTYKSGDIIDLTCRMFHFDSINVKVGDKVTKDTVIGMYGNTGSTLVNGKRMGKHLHIEFDIDTQWPTLTYGVSKGGAIFNRTEDVNKAGGLADSTINPSYIWSLDYNQSIKGIYSGWYTNDDINIPKYTDVADTENSKEEDVIVPNNVIAEGIDISEHNGNNIDFIKVKESGKDFVMVRAGWTWYEGGFDIDDEFENNIKKAIDAGLDVGVYAYAYDKSVEAAKIGAQKLIELIKPYKLTYPVVYDIEDDKTYSGELTNTPTEIADAFLSEIEKAGYYSMLYSYIGFINKYLDMEKLSKYDTWIAYTGATSMSIDERFNKLNQLYKHPYGIWQYAGDADGKCEGVNGACDNDYAYKNYPVLIREAKLNHLDEDTETSENETIIALKKEIEKLNKDLSNMKQERDIAISENKSLRDYISEIKKDIIDYGNSIGEDGFSI